MVSTSPFWITRLWVQSLVNALLLHSDFASFWPIRIKYTPPPIRCSCMRDIDFYIFFLSFWVQEPKLFCEVRQSCYLTTDRIQVFESWLTWCCASFDVVIYFVATCFQWVRIYSLTHLTIVIIIQLLLPSFWTQELTVHYSE